MGGFGFCGRKRVSWHARCRGWPSTRHEKVAAPGDLMNLRMSAFQLKYAREERECSVPNSDPSLECVR